MLARRWLLGALALAAAYGCAEAKKKKKKASKGGGSCAAHSSCEDCMRARCGWCLAAERCVTDKPGGCSGPGDHVGESGYSRICPTAEDLAARGPGAGAKLSRPEEVSEDPDAFLVDFVLSGTVDGVRRSRLGTVTVQMNPGWAPRGVGRIRELLDLRFFDDMAFFQVLNDESSQMKLVQGGIHGDPETMEKWTMAMMKDDHRLVTNSRGTLSFAANVPSGRATQFIINLSENGETLDGVGVTGLRPFGVVVSGAPVPAPLATKRRGELTLGARWAGIELLDQLQSTQPATSKARRLPKRPA